MKDKIMTRRQAKAQKNSEVINIDSDSHQEHKIIQKVKDNLELLLMQNKQIQESLRKQQKIPGQSSPKQPNQKQKVSIERDSDSEYSSSQSEQSIQFNNLAPKVQSNKKKPFQGLKAFFMEQNTEARAQSHKFPLANQGTQKQFEPEGQIDSDDIPSPQPLSQEQPQFKQQLKNRPRPFENISEPSQKKRLSELLQLEEQINKNILANKSQEQIQEQMKKIEQVRAQRKKQNKKVEYLIEKKYKEMKVGKKKDRVSNEVFNAIQDYFM